MTRLRAGRVLRLRPPMRRSLESIARSVEQLAATTQERTTALAEADNALLYDLEEVLYRWSHGYGRESKGWIERPIVRRTVTVVASNAQNAFRRADEALNDWQPRIQYRDPDPDNPDEHTVDRLPVDRRDWVITATRPRTTTNTADGDPS